VKRRPRRGGKKEAMWSIALEYTAEQYSSSLQCHDGTSTSPITLVCATSAGREGELAPSGIKTPRAPRAGGGGVS